MNKKEAITYIEIEVIKGGYLLIYSGQDFTVKEIFVNFEDLLTRLSTLVKE